MRGRGEEAESEKKKNEKKNERKNQSLFYRFERARSASFFRFLSLSSSLIDASAPRGEARGSHRAPQPRRR